MPLSRGIELDLKARGAPGDQRAKRSVRVDECAEPRGRLIGDAVRIAVEADRRDPHERPLRRTGLRSADQAEIDRARDSMRDDRTRRHRIIRNPEHAGEIIPATPGEHSENRTVEITKSVGESARQAVAAEGDHGFTAHRRPPPERAGVVEVARVRTAHRQPIAAQGALHRRRDAAALPPPATGLTIRHTRLGTAQA